MPGLDCALFPPPPVYSPQKGKIPRTKTSTGTGGAVTYWCRPTGIYGGRDTDTNPGQARIVSR
ncbi:hypothetical protein J6590_093601 [Homalodisca vitripennis]|nr:hypothetical protein J6590_093601 [Homalodisca vitripennis]